MTHQVLEEYNSLPIAQISAVTILKSKLKIAIFFVKIDQNRNRYIC